MDEVRITPKVEHPRCPYCHEAVKATDDKAPCLACMAWHHRACRDEHGRCAACGAPAHGAVAPEDTGAPPPSAWWRATGRATPAPPPRVARRPDAARDEPTFGEQPALPPPEQRHAPLGALALLGYLALLAALTAVLMLLAA